MAYIPTILHNNPKDVLIIAFGMGSTYRSALKLDLNVTAVELVPSVPTFMNLYFTDSDKVLANPKGHIIINDGRNFAALTKQKYDIVIIDPPPPFNAAGTSVLHSKEFYQDLINILKPFGIVAQWIYYSHTREDDISMAIKSFTDVFPYTLALHKIDGAEGIFLQGSKSPIKQKRLKNLYRNQTFLNDLKEVEGQDFVPNENDFLEIIGNRHSLIKEVCRFQPITDNHPQNEYYLLRQSLFKSPRLEGLDAYNFILRLKKSYL